GVAAVSGSACFRFSPVVAQVPAMSPAGSRPLLPMLQAEGDGSARVIGHYDPWAHGRGPSKGPTNLLLHFASSGAGETAALLQGALAARKGDAAVLAVGVVPAGELSR